ncbi:MAG: hypothetical protein JWM14_3260 [Chitinophagaceae bacterium]|nr:hypothetical protein [Chitinophagaceae bacterium]
MNLTFPNKDLLNRVMNIHTQPNASSNSMEITAFINILKIGSGDLYIEESGTIYYACRYIKDFCISKEIELRYSKDKDFRMIQGLAELYELSKELYFTSSKQSDLSKWFHLPKSLIQRVTIDLTIDGKKWLPSLYPSITINGSEAVKLLQIALSDLFAKQPYEDWNFSSFALLEYYDIINFKHIDINKLDDGASVKDILFNPIRSFTKQLYTLFKEIHPDSSSTLIVKTILNLYKHFNIPLPIPSRAIPNSGNTIIDQDMMSEMEEELIRMIRDWVTNSI